MEQVVYAMPVAQSSAEARANFIRKTYNYVTTAIVSFALLEWLFFQTGIAKKLFEFAMVTNWLLFLGAFMVIGWIANHLAMKSQSSLAVQHTGLGLYILAEAFIFAPLLYMAVEFIDISVVYNAAMVTAAMVLGLTFIAFTSNKDFSFLGGALRLLGFIALGLIISGVIFGFTLGTWFSVLMVIFASGAILYDTSNILHHYSEDQYVAASLSLFASIALLFWYLLQLFMNRD